MAYSIAGTEIISNTGVIAWSKVINFPVWANNVTTDYIATAGALVNTSHYEVQFSSASLQLVRYNYDCNCNCDCVCSCFLKGTKVLMADGFEKPIEEIRAGEKVLSAIGIGTVLGFEDNIILGNTRNIIRLGKTLMTDDHRTWVMMYGKQGWGTYNPKHLLYELDFDENMKDEWAKNNFFSLKNQEAHCHATIDGWKYLIPEYLYEYTSKTPLYTLKVDLESFFADGLLVSSYAKQNTSEQINWGPHEIQR